MAVITLSQAMAAARIGAWHVILDLPRHDTPAEIAKARRWLQLRVHEDKGGNGELSSIINRAADELLANHPDAIRQRMQRQAREERDEREQMEQEQAEKRRMARECQKRYAEERCAQHVRSQHRAVKRTSARGASARQKAYLSPSVQLIFPRIGTRIRRFQEKREWQRARSLAYAVEADIAARRAVREHKFPKTAGLASRNPHKALLLEALKSRYNVVYQRIRYLEKRGARVGLAVPRMERVQLLRQAWQVLLAAPAPLQGVQPAMALSNVAG